MLSRIVACVGVLCCAVVGMETSRGGTGLKQTNSRAMAPPGARTGPAAVVAEAGTGPAMLTPGAGTGPAMLTPGAGTGPAMLTPGADTGPAVGAARHSPFPPPGAALERDLDSVRQTPGTSGRQKWLLNQRPAPLSRGPEYNSAIGTTEEDLDLKLLYDLIRAVEYEANEQLFDRVLADLDNANYQVDSSAGQADLSPSPARDLAPQDESMDEIMQMQNNANMAPSAADTRPVKLGGDNKGTVMAQQAAPPAPGLHKRLSAALRDVPRQTAQLADAAGGRPRA